MADEQRSRHWLFAAAVATVVCALLLATRLPAEGDDDDGMSPDDEAIGMVIPDGFRLQESRPAALDSSLVKRGVLVRLSMG